MQSLYPKNLLSLASLTLFAGAALVASGCSVEVNGGNKNTGSSSGTGSNTSGNTTSTKSTGGGNGSGTGTGTKSGDTTGTGTGGGGANMGVCNRTAKPTLTVEGDINTDAVWSGVVLLSKSVSVSGSAKLTIQPGTTIIAKPDVGLEIGYLSGKNTLIAKGTKEQPIHFCGESNTAGSWKGIKIADSATSLNSMEFVSVDNAGVAQGAALNLGAPVLIKNVSVKNSAGDGVRAAEFSANSANLTVSTTAAPVRLTSDKAFTNFPVGGALKGNTKDFVMVDFSSIDEDVTVKKLDVPYLQLKDLSHEAQAVWTIEAGVQYKLAADRTLQSGYIGGKTTLKWMGTAAAPIVFSGETAAAGSWAGILVGKTTTTTSKIGHVKIQHGGANTTPSLRVLSPIMLNDVSVEDAKLGLDIGEKGLASGSANVSGHRITDHPITAHANALVSMPVGGTFTGNAKNTIKVATGSLGLGGTIPKMTVPYLLSSGLTAENADLLTFAPGSVFEVAADQKIEFGYIGAAGEVKIVGTQAEPIVIRGAAKTAGSWKTIHVRKSVPSTSKFDYVQISDGGQGNTGLVDLDRAISITNSKFSNSAGYGIRRQSDDTTNYNATNTFDKVASGNIGTK